METEKTLKEMSEEIEEGTCKNCGKTIDHTDAGDELCYECMIELCEYWW